MARRLPAIYALIVLAELVGLTWRYATDPPSSSSPFSIGLGWAALGSMIVMLVYSIARRSRALRQVARLSAWLHFHIYLGVQGVLFAVFHSLHLFTRQAPVQLLNPAVLNLILVLIVFSSGLFGRYLYSLLPRTLSGEQMAVREVEAELTRLGAKLPDEIESLLTRALSASSGLGLLKADRVTRRSLAKLRGLSLDPELHALAERRLRLHHRLRMLAAANRIFQQWIILHRPLASIM